MTQEREFNVWEGVYSDFATARTFATGRGFEGSTWLDSMTQVFDDCSDAIKSKSMISSFIKQRYLNLPFMMALSINQHQQTTSRTYRILDIGGGLASLNFTCLQSVEGFADNVEHHIVENEAVCKVGQQKADNAGLNVHFHTAIPKEDFDFVLCISCLQYVEDWPLFIKELSAKGAPLVYLGDIFCSDVESFVTLQNYYESKIPHWFVNRRDFLKVVNDNGYDLLACIESTGLRNGERDKLPMRNFPEQYQCEYAYNFLFQRRGK